ncbi:MAG: penicillin-insensitive murein endopeptidase [Deltaproteobacteria bacterium]|nr:penicillin-insensitive murein endopeptidase [Deltaproteobacteria bacterium]
MSCRVLIPVVLFVAFVGAPSGAYAYKYTHEVLPAERLRDIAKRYHTTTRRIMRHNRLRSQRLRAGRKLKIVTSIPSRTRRKVRYAVVKRDTLSRIARKHKMKLWLLKRLNTSAAKRRLKPGQRLWVVVEGPRPSGGVKGLYQLTSGPGYKVRNQQRAWGTFLSVTQIHDVLSSYGLRFPKTPPLLVMDLSRKGGGLFRPHKSHRQGRDVDIRYPKLKKYRRIVRTRPKMLDLQRTWFVVKRFLDTKDVTFMFMDHPLQRVLYNYALKHGETKKSLHKVFQYPRGKRALHGTIRHEPGHATHLHVRFRREPKKVPTS